MEKTGEARRSTTMAASNGLKNRSHRISGNSSEQMHHEVTTVGDGPGKKERDPESLNRSKRRRCGRFAPRYERDVEEDNSDDDDVQHNYHSKSFPSGRISRHVSSLKVADEMIGVPVPRKARSACIKRSHDCRTSSGSGGGGFGEDRKRPPASPASYSFEVVSPSCSTLSVKQKHKKNVNGCKSGIPKPPKSSGTVEDDLEIEIAEVLSGLKKQPHRSKREDDSENSLTPVEANGAKKLKTDEDDFLACRSTNGIKTSSSPKQRLDSRDSEVSKGVEGPLLANIRDETYNCGSMVEIDLMVPPTISSSPGRVSLPPLVSDYCKRDSYVQSKEQVITKTDTIAEEITQKKVEISDRLNLDVERPNQETSGDSNSRSMNFYWSDHQAKSVSVPQSSVLPSPVAANSWPSGLPAQGNVHSIQTCKTVDDCSGSSTLVQDAPLCVSQRMPKRCATHFFIAQNIQLHQHFAKTKHLPTPNKGSAYLKGGDLRLATVNTSLQGSSSILCSYSQPHDRIADNICAPKDKASESGHFATSRQKKPQSPPASSSILPAPAFIFPTNHHLQPVMVPSKSPLPIKSQRVVVSSASVNFSHPNSSASEASLPYFTVLPNNAYSVQMSSTIRGGSPSQTLPFFNGSCYSPHTFQQPSQLLQTQSQAQRESKTSSCSSTSQSQRHQASVNSLSSQANIQQHCQQSQRSEAKAVGDNSVLRGNHTHKGGQYGQIMTPPGQPQNFSMSFASFTSAPTNLNFSSNGYHVIPAPPVGHHKNHQASDLKTGRGGSCSKSNSEDLKKTIQGKPQAMMNAQTLFFDNPSRTLNFVSGSWLPPAATAINGDPSVFTQHLTQKQQQSGRSKMITHSQADSVSVTSSQWKNPATSSITSSSSLNPTKFQSLQPIRKYGQTQISFAAAAAASKLQPSQGQQGRSAGYSTPVIGSASHSQAANPKGSNSKAMPLSEHAQEKTDNTALGSTQKTSPVCRRTVPPIITSSPNHLSELKY